MTALPDSTPQASGRAPGLFVAPGVVIPDDADIGVHVVLRAGVELGAGCVIQDGAVLGKPPLRNPTSRAPIDAGGRTNGMAPGTETTAEGAAARTEHTCLRASIRSLTREPPT